MDRKSKVEETEVRVVTYDPSWPEQFQEESRSVRAALGDFVFQIEHFGSTAVPGLDAKPIVDILIGTNQGGKPPKVHLDSLASLGYEFLGEDGRRPGRWFFRKRGLKSFNLSIVPANGHLWRDNLMVRDYLRAHPDEAARYAAIKRTAAKAEPTSLLRFQDRKRAFIKAMKDRARPWQEMTHRSHSI